MVLHVRTARRMRAPQSHTHKNKYVCFLQSAPPRSERGVCNMHCPGAYQVR